jgi:hypothetical protein
MQEKRTEAISRLARIERGRRSRQAFLDGLSSAVGSTVHAEQLLELAVTDQVRASLSLGYARAVRGEANARRSFFSRGESHTALQIPEALTSLPGEERVLLWLKQSADCFSSSILFQRRRYGLGCALISWLRGWLSEYTVVPAEVARASWPLNSFSVSRTRGRAIPGAHSFYAGA